MPGHYRDALSVFSHQSTDSYYKTAHIRGRRPCQTYEEPILHRQPIPADVLLKLPYITADLRQVQNGLVPQTQNQIAACDGVLGRHSNGPFIPKSITVKTLLYTQHLPFMLSRVRQGALK